MRPLAEIAARMRGVMGMNRRNLELVRPRNPRAAFPLADDKIEAKAFLTKHGLPVPATLQVYEAFYQLRSFPSDLACIGPSAPSSFVIKPASGRGGSGIVVIGSRDGDHWLTLGGRRLGADELRRHLATILFGGFSLGADDRALIEERLVAEQALHELSPQGLPDLRILVVDAVPVLGMLRVATRRSRGKANLHQGGLGIGLDLETGRTTTAVVSGVRVHKHPDTGRPLSGVRVPHWDQVLEMSRKLGKISPLRFIGIDVALVEARGPVVLEFNARPGLEIQNANAIGLREALVRRGIRVLEPAAEPVAPRFAP